MRTPIGVLEVVRVDVVQPDAITEEEARRAGDGSLDELLAALERHGEGEVHRIELRFAGPDPRVALRARSRLDAGERAEIAARLARLDRASSHGPWTEATLRAIAAAPGTRAADLAAGFGRERLSFKADVRKLKALGLTESLEVGYRLSPRGLAYLRSVSANDNAT